MAFANTSITDVIASTIQNRSRTIADNVTKNNALLADRLSFRRRQQARPDDRGKQLPRMDLRATRHRDRGRRRRTAGHAGCLVGTPSAPAAALRDGDRR